MTHEPTRSEDQDPRPDEPAPDPLEKLRGASYTGSGVGQYAGFGVQFAIAILLFLYLGNWVDRKVGTSPLFLVLGVFLGAGASFYSIYRRLMADQQAAKEERAERAKTATKERKR